jgi:hypothetical protein
MMSKGALHIHSLYSDGEWSLAELRELYLHDGCRFACVTDHADAFDAERASAYVAECARLSDASFLFVPGLEFSCTDRMHIVGYGVTALTPEVDPIKVMEHISASGGVSVIAHPKDAHFAWIEQFERLPDGLEVWNSKYDGRYAPRPATFRLLERLRARRPDLRAFYGQDLHWQKQHRGLFVHLDTEAVSGASILDALRRGAFRGHKDGVWLPSDGAIPEALMKEMERAHRRSDQMRRVLKTVKRAADRLGLRLPSTVKAQARRVM